MKVKRTPGIPLMFIIQNTIVLDKPSPRTVAFVKAVEAGQLVSVHEKQSIKQLKEEQGLVRNPDLRRRRRKKKKVGGPNPLSCLKKKKKAQDTKSPASEKKRKRKRIRNRSTLKVSSEQQGAEG